MRQNSKGGKHAAKILTASKIVQISSTYTVHFLDYVFEDECCRETVLGSEAVTGYVLKEYLYCLAIQLKVLDLYCCCEKKNEKRDQKFCIKYKTKESQISVHQALAMIDVIVPKNKRCSSLKKLNSSLM